MDSYTLFKRLSSGAKFDFKRFRDDAEKLKLVRKHPPESVECNDKNSGFSPSPRNLTENQNDMTNKSQKFFRDSSFVKKRKLSGWLDNENEHTIKMKDRCETFGESEEDNESRKDTSRDIELLQSSDDDESGANILLTCSKAKKTCRKKKKNRMLTSEKLIAQKQEHIRHIRKEYRINVWGSDIPDPIISFEQLLEDYKISPLILGNIKRLGYITPTPIQMQAISLMIDRREILACAPTGSGKTAAFLIPILHYLKGPSKNGFRVVIVSPTRELANQIYRDCLQLAEGTGLKACIMRKSHTKTVQKIEKDILVTTPNRLVYLLQEPAGINLKSVEWLIIDESDKLFETGTLGFRDQLAVIYKACDSSNIRRAMFSATFSFDVEEWCKLNLDNVVMISIGVRNSAAESVKQELIFVGDESGKLLELRNIIKKGIMPPVLIFVETKERARELFSELIYEGINIDVIHSERTQEQRDNVVKSFRAGKVWILICTELMGRGMDFKGVNLVINYDFPRSAISYIHRIGRTGRAGRSGHAITFFTETDRVILRSIAQVMKNSGCEVPDYMLKLKKPSKKVKRQLLKKAPKRERISTVPLYDLEKQAKKEKLVLRSKLRKTSRKEAEKRKL